MSYNDWKADFPTYQYEGMPNLQQPLMNNEHYYGRTSSNLLASPSPLPYEMPETSSPYLSNGDVFLTAAPVAMHKIEKPSRKRKLNDDLVVIPAQKLQATEANNVVVNESGLNAPPLLVCDFDPNFDQLPDSLWYTNTPKPCSPVENAAPVVSYNIPSVAEEGDNLAQELNVIIPDYELNNITAFIDIPSSSDEAHAILDNMLGEVIDVIDPRATLNMTAESTPASTPTDNVPLNKKIRAKDLPKCWHSGHIEAFIHKQMPYEYEEAKPIVRCVHSREHFYELPKRLHEQFREALGPQPNDTYRKHTMAVFLDMGDYDLLVALIFLQQYGEQSIPGNQRRIFLETHFTLSASDLSPDQACTLHTFADELFREALIGYFNLMGKCGYQTIHFKAHDESSQTWCKDLLDRAKETGSILDCRTLEGEPIYHFFEWMEKAKSTRRDVKKIPLLEGDDLPQVIDTAIRKRQQSGNLNMNQMWLSVNRTLKKTNNESFVAGLSHCGQLMRCTCQACQTAGDCRLMDKAMNTSIFDSESEFIEAAKLRSFCFDTLSDAEAATSECIMSAMA